MPEDAPDTAPHHHEQTGDRRADDSRMSFGDHLDQLRVTLIRAIIGWFLATIVCMVFGKEVLGVVFRPLLLAQHANGLPPTLQVLSPMAGFTSYLKIAFIAGLIVSMPWVIYQVWAFVAPGLYGHEQRSLKKLVPLSGGLFVVGVAFLYFVVLPIVLHFFIQFNQSFALPDFAGPSLMTRLLSDEPAPADVGPVGDGGSADGEAAATDGSSAPFVVVILDADPPSPAVGAVWFNRSENRFKINTPAGLMMTAAFERQAAGSALQSQFAVDFYISFVLMLALGFGVAFQMPIVVYFLARTEIVPLEVMVKGRRYILLGIVIAAAVLTPPDVISQLLLAAPMYALFELGLLAARAKERKPAEA
jgi:sec-independent protein translocase protein TatC